MGKKILILVCKALCVSLAGLGPGALLGRFAFHDYRGDAAAEYAALSFGIAFLLASWMALTERTADYLRAVATSTALSIIAAVTVSAVFELSFFNRLTTAETVLVFLTSAFAGQVGAATRWAKCHVADRLSTFLSSAAIGSGIGFIEGYVIDPGTGPSMVQDGGALSGFVAGAALGVLLSRRLITNPGSSTIWSLSAITVGIGGAASAWAFGYAAAVITPLIAGGACLAIGFRSERHLQPQ